ncbi:hypothetical protein Lser_V15G20514 [Lactuca serriola]
MEFDSFYYSPYRVQNEQDDDASITKKHIKELNAKLDTLMASSSSHHPYSEAAIQTMLDSFVKAHDASISNATAAITASTKGAATLNASKVTSSITKLEEAFSAEKQNFATLRQDIQKDNVALLSSLNEHFTKLQANLAMENSVMDELALKTTQPKTKNLQLSQANNEVNQLRFERAVVKSYVSYVHAILLNVLEAHDPILTISVRRHLSDKFRPALGMLSRIEGVSETMVPPKQGGEGLASSSQPPPTSQPQKKKTEHASGSGFKAKGKVTMDDSDEEEETNVKALKRKSREREINLIAKIVKEGEENERRLKEFDMPITPKAFVFHCFLPIAEVPRPDTKVDREFIDYYLEFTQRQYLTWNTQKIITIRVLHPQAAGKYINVKFKVTRGSALSEHAFSIVDPPNLNPHDWIVLHNILLSNPVEYEPIIDHLKRLLVCYILEVAKMDQEITPVLRKKPIILSVGSASDVNKMKMEKIDPVLNYVMFTIQDGKKCLFAFN